MDTCIIKTLSYFDVFDYPLTFEEIKKYFCCSIDCSDDELYEVINAISSIQETGGYYYLLGRQDIVGKRSERADASFRKYTKAKVIAKLLSVIPTIEYIGISGSLAMNNATISDDIDLFFIAKKNTLWITRLAVNGILFSINQKRKKSGGVVKDKICPNMLMVEGKLAFSGKRKNLYTAHEIAQLKTIFDRNNSHARFLTANKWIKEYLPNIPFPKKEYKKNTFADLALKLLIPVERIVYIFQLLYMRKERSNEMVSAKQAFFHPVNRQKLILDMYELRYKRYKRLNEENMWIDKDEARFYWEEKKARILN